MYKYLQIQFEDFSEDQLVQTFGQSHSVLPGPERLPTVTDSDCPLSPDQDFSPSSPSLGDRSIGPSVFRDWIARQAVCSGQTCARIEIALRWSNKCWTMWIIQMSKNPSMTVLYCAHDCLAIWVAVPYQTPNANFWSGRSKDWNRLGPFAIYVDALTVKRWENAVMHCGFSTATNRRILNQVPATLHFCWRTQSCWATFVGSVASWNGVVQVVITLRRSPTVV